MKSKFTVIPIIIMVISLIFPLVFPDITDDIQTLVYDINDFGFVLYQELKVEKDNLFFSPYSISKAFAMTYTGARGQTKTEKVHCIPSLYIVDT
jgi:serine protease inhibitor